MRLDSIIQPLCRPIGGAPPSQFLPDLIARAGWSIKQGPVPGRRWAMCDAWEKTIWIDDRFYEVLRRPDRADRLRAQRIAHEWGHGMLHVAQILHGQRTATMEDAATRFSQQLLLPPWAIAREIQELRGREMPAQNVLWRMVLDLADQWGITGAFAAAALESYTVITVCRRTRHIQQVAA